MTDLTRFVTPEDIIKAAEENGYKWSRQGWFKHAEDGTIIEACVLGQVAINLGVERASIAMYLATFKIPDNAPIRKKYPELNDVWGIVGLNDSPYRPNSPKTYKDIVSILKQAILDSNRSKEGVLMPKAIYKAKKREFV